jgi:hypothetical protein
LSVLCKEEESGITGAEGAHSVASGMDGTTAPSEGPAAPGHTVDAVRVEDLDPLRIFERYMTQLEVSGEASNIGTNGASAAETAGEAPTGIAEGSEPLSPVDAVRQLHSRVLQEGRETLERLLGTANAESKASGVAESRLGGDRRAKELVLDLVHLYNFGPYGGERAVEYPLSKRGLVLIRGQSMDGTGADSNGAGKVSAAFHCCC